MSEWDACVYCTCFQDGLTNDPPYPRSELTVNRFGVVTMVGSTDHAEDPKPLWCWRVGMSVDDPHTDEAPQPCRHHNMKLVDEIFYWPGSVSHVGHYPVFERLVATYELPVLGDLLYRPPADDYPSGGVWTDAEEAQQALRELDELAALAPLDPQTSDSYFAKTLRTLLEASVKTGNPVICNYNGIGDGAW